MGRRDAARLPAAEAKKPPQPLRVLCIREKPAVGEQMQGGARQPPLRARHDVTQSLLVLANHARPAFRILTGRSTRLSSGLEASLIATQPSDQSITTARSISLNAAASGSGFSWIRDGENRVEKIHRTAQGNEWDPAGFAPKHGVNRAQNRLGARLRHAKRSGKLPPERSPLRVAADRRQFTR